MTLVNRATVFLLTTLAVVLGGYSLGLFYLLSQYLSTEFSDRLQGALQILTASVEVEPEDVTWYPQEFTLDFDEKTLRDTRWVIANEHGTLVDHSPLLDPQSAEDAIVLDYAATSEPRHQGALDRGNWRIVQRRIAAPNPQPVSTREFNEYASLVITVALSRQPLEATVAQLGWLLTGMSVAIWLITAALGRTIVKRSLKPLIEMADRAQSVTGADFSIRLPLRESPDEIRHLGVAFNRLLDQLHQAYERQSQFTGNAAHQLRTPLTVLQGHLDVALLRPRTEREYTDCLQTLTSVVREMTQIVESLLYLARDGADSALPACESIDLSSWLSQYVNRWRSHPRWDDLEFHLNEPVEVQATSSLLIQLLDNLIHNGLRYSEAGSPVRLEIDADEHRVTFRVIDQGIGLSESEMEAIFEPFYRSARARQRGIPGIGLGLTIARQIARTLGGTLECAPGERGGMVFILALPRQMHV